MTILQVASLINAGNTGPPRRPPLRCPKGAQTGRPPRSIGRSRRDGGQRAGVAGAGYQSAFLFLGGNCFPRVGEAFPPGGGSPSLGWGKPFPWEGEALPLGGGSPSLGRGKPFPWVGEALPLGGGSPSLGWGKPFPWEGEAFPLGGGSLSLGWGKPFPWVGKALHLSKNGAGCAAAPPACPQPAPSLPPACPQPAPSLPPACPRPAPGLPRAYPPHVEEHRHPRRDHRPLEPRQQLPLLRIPGRHPLRSLGGPGLGRPPYPQQPRSPGRPRRPGHLQRPPGRPADPSARPTHGKGLKGHFIPAWAIGPGIGLCQGLRAESPAYRFGRTRMDRAFSPPGRLRGVFPGPVAQG